MTSEVAEPFASEYDTVPVDPETLQEGEEPVLHSAVPQRWGRRHRVLAGSLTGLVIGLCGGLAYRTAWFSLLPRHGNVTKIVDEYNNMILSEKIMVGGVPVFMNPNAAIPADMLHTYDDGRRDWLLKFPDVSNDTDMQGLRKRIPPGASVRFQGSPSMQGLPIVLVRATIPELTLVLTGMQGKIEFVEQDFVVTATPEVGLDVADTSNISSFSMRRLQTRTQPRPPWGLDRIDQRELPLSDSFKFDASAGRGVHLYIVDTGIRTSHQEFTGRAVPTLESVGGGPVVCSPQNPSCAEDANGHGTHVAGIAAGSTFGVAKAATVHAVKVLSSDGRGRWSWLIAALDWIIVNGQRPAVISMSLGCGTPCRAPSLVSAVRRVGDAGLTVVVAAGNDNSDACNYGPPSATNAIAVGSTDRRDARSYFSNYGTCVDVFAPGSDIVSASSKSDTGAVVLSGTSMSCPHVSGTAASVLSKDPGMSRQQVASLLTWGCATHGRVRNPGSGSPNTLLYNQPCNARDTPPPPRSTITTTTTICFWFCFPGQSIVHMEGVGAVPMDSLKVGDHVLVEEAPGKLAYQPVLTFLHARPGHPDSLSSFLTVTHTRGEFRASANHLVFTSSPSGRVTKVLRDCREGDELFLTGENNTSLVLSSRILAIVHGQTNRGMYAPLTEAGTIVVDNVVASTYAMTWGLRLPQTLVHGVFFPLRLYYRFGLARVFRSLWEPACDKSEELDGKCRAKEVMHPMAALMHKHLQLDRLLAAVAAHT